MAREMLSATTDVVILCWETPERCDLRAQKIAAFLGAETTLVCLTTAALGDGASIWDLVPKCTCLIVNAETLAKAADAIQAASELPSLTELAQHVFISGFQPTDRHDAILQALSSGGLLGAQPLPDGDAQFHVAQGHRKCCGQFSGLSLGAVDPTREHSFVEGTVQPQPAVVIRAGESPFFVRTENGRSQVFFLACSELADLDEEVGRETRLLSWFSRLIPLMMFLREALGDRLWHNDQPRACFIIDDPLLKRRYGFLEYPRLLEALDQHRFTASIAFIPWNYRRSRRHIAELFFTPPIPLSLCVHGCDHTKAEFASTNFELLCGKARVALRRMQAHSQLVGIPFDDVMVFPQGLFSAEALKALDALGYLAAVNTHLCPSNMPQALRLCDLLGVAVTAFSDIPLFARHYPGHPAEFALDLFMGKPAFVVEHHGYFRNGYESLGHFVKQLNALDERLAWGNLASICSRACLRKVVPSGDVHVRFYTNRFHLTNTGTRTQTYLLFRRRTSEGPLPSVAVNGYQWVREQKDDSLAISLSLDAGQEADIRVFSEPPADTAGSLWKPRASRNARIFARRVLCEFRDNYVETNRVLAGLLSISRKLRPRKGSA